MSQYDNHHHARRQGKFKKAYKDMSKRVRGEGNVKAKLTEDKVRLIRLSHEDNKKLAKMWNVSRCTIYSIKNNTTWKHVKAE